MFKRFLIIVPYLWVCQLFTSYAVTDFEYSDLVETFKIIRTNTVWPVAGGGFDDVEETFGPRIQPSTGLYDWHRGVDIDGGHGTNVLAAVAGTFYRYTNYAAGGWTVILRHLFPMPLNYNNKTLNYYYTFYMHLDDTNTLPYIQNLQTGDPVAKGQQIGIMGNSGKSPGDDYAVHLHFECRVGATASLEFQLNNTNTTQWGFDPHMHPMFLYPPLDYNMALNLIQPLTLNQDGIIEYEANNDDQPLLNRVEVNILDVQFQNSVASHVLELNRRIGYNASSVASLDTQNTNYPYLDPVYFIDSQTNYNTRIVVPKQFAGNYANPNYEWRVSCEDIWGKKIVYSSLTGASGGTAYGDFNNDGQADILTQKKNKVYVLAQSNGIYLTNFMLTTLPRKTKVVGILGSSSNLLVKQGIQLKIMGIANGTITEQKDLLILSSGMEKSIATGDLNSDGQMDVVTQKGKMIGMYLRQGTNFTSWQPIVTNHLGKMIATLKYDTNLTYDILQQKGKIVTVLLMGTNHTVLNSIPTTTLTKSSMKIRAVGDIISGGKWEWITQQGKRIGFLQTNAVVPQILVPKSGKLGKVVASK